MSRRAWAWRAGMLLALFCTMHAILAKCSAFGRGWCYATAVIAEKLCGFSEIQAVREGATLITDKMAIRITSGCTGWFWVATCMALSFASRRPAWQRVGFAAAWSIVVLVANQIRIVTLALAGIVSAEWFFFLDNWAWPIAHGGALYLALSSFVLGASARRSGSSSGLRPVENRS